MAALPVNCVGTSAINFATNFNKIGRTIDQFLLLAISRIIDIVYYGYSMIRFTTGDMTGLDIIRLVMFSNDYQKKEMISYD